MENQQEIQTYEIQQEENGNLLEIDQQEKQNENQLENSLNENTPAQTLEINHEDLDIDTKKENFRVYLEEKGMMEILTKLLVELYERNDRPIGSEESFEYCSRFFSKLEGFDINMLNAEIEQNKEKLKDLQGKLDELNKELTDPDQQ